MMPRYINVKRLENSMIDKALVIAWVQQHAPESIKDILLDGTDMVYRDRADTDKRKDMYPNEGFFFTDKECEQIMALANEISDSNLSIDLTEKIEAMFGRPIKSLRNKLRYMKSKEFSDGEK